MGSEVIMENKRARIEETSNEITKQHLIMCEGKNDLYFLLRYLDSKFQEALNNIHIEYGDAEDIASGGKDQILKNIMALSTRTGYYEKLESLLIIIDSDNNPSGTFASVRNALEKAGFPIPQELCKIVCGPGPKGKERIKIGCALLPELNSITATGVLEDLCLKILNKNNDHHDELLKIADDSISTVEDTGI
jgi:hypothetical protein